MSSDSESEKQLRRDRDLAELCEWFRQNENLPQDIGNYHDYRDALTVGHDRKRKRELVFLCMAIY